jgi:hypothetical protein
MRLLAKALETYKRKHNNTYPARLAALAEGDRVLVPKRDLQDPWGQPYQYDAAGKRNKGTRPDIWSPGHPIEKKPIGNWMHEPTTKQADDRKTR